MTRDEVRAILEFVAGAYERFPVTENRVGTWAATFRHTANERVWAASRSWVSRDARPPTPADLNAIIRGHERVRADVLAAAPECMICEPVGWVITDDGSVHGSAMRCPSGCKPEPVMPRS